MILAEDEKQRMADIARPAWKDWIVDDFGVEESLVDELWAEVDRIDAELEKKDKALYGG